MSRRLAAILAADVAGYSRLMEEDEDGTLSSLHALQAEVIDPTIAKHRGRIVKLMGDGLLAEFASVADAVDCALDVQQGIAERAAGLPENRQLRFRIGINLGDIIIRENDIYGDGVNIAARLQELAAPGAVCIAGAVFDQMRRRTGLAFDDLGEQRVKNIERPLRVYRVVSGVGSTSATTLKVYRTESGWASRRHWCSFPACSWSMRRPPTNTATPRSPPRGRVTSSRSTTCWAARSSKPGTGCARSWS
jgi:adenylate cyclase